MVKRIGIPLIFLFLFLLGWVPQVQAASSDIVNLRLMETTDLHAKIFPYDYHKKKPNHRYGFALTATLIRKARSQVNNSLLFDDGRCLKGRVVRGSIISG